MGKGGVNLAVGRDVDMAVDARPGRQDDWADLFDGDACAAWLRASNNPTQVL